MQWRRSVGRDAKCTLKMAYAAENFSVFSSWFSKKNTKGMIGKDSRCMSKKTAIEKKNKYETKGHSFRHVSSCGVTAVLSMKKKGRSPTDTLALSTRISEPWQVFWPKEHIWVAQARGEQRGLKKSRRVFLGTSVVPSMKRQLYRFQNKQINAQRVFLEGVLESCHTVRQ